MKSCRTALPALFAFVLVVAPALAHDSMSSWSVARLRPNGLELRVTLGVEAVQLLMGRQIGPIDDSTPALLQQLKSRARTLCLVSDGGAPLLARSVAVNLEEEDGVEVKILYPRPRRGPLRFELSYLKNLPSGHKTSLTLLSETDQIIWSQLPTASSPVVEMKLPDEMLARATGSQTDSFDRGGGSGQPNGDPDAPKEAPAGHPVAAGGEPQPQITPTAPLHTPSFWEFLQLGVEHIITGYDHLLFLFGLLVACRRFRSIAAIITCFTIAHSITLALAALDVVVISGRIIEPLIAASIVFVGIDNLVRRGEPKGRWILTFAFGLVHGFGFAGVLKQIGLGSSGASIAVPLFSFNLGVELGQIAVTAIVLPVLWKLGTMRGFSRHGRAVISVLVALVGAYWLTQRIFF